jgi:hypothetical protein
VETDRVYIQVDISFWSSRKAVAVDPLILVGHGFKGVGDIVAFLVQ